MSFTYERKHFSKYDDHDLENQANTLENKLNHGTYWYAEEVGRDHKRLKAIREELKIRSEEN